MPLMGQGGIGVALAQEYGFSRSTPYRARGRVEGKIVEISDGLQDPNRRWTVQD